MNMPHGYTRRPDGDYEKRCEFVQKRSDGHTPTRYVETLIRTTNGRLLRVERSKGALSKRKLR